VKRNNHIALQKHPQIVVDSYLSDGMLAVNIHAMIVDTQKQETIDDNTLFR
jgi:hypothetical protein